MLRVKVQPLKLALGETLSAAVAQWSRQCKVGGSSPAPTASTGSEKRGNCLKKTLPGMVAHSPNHLMDKGSSPTTAAGIGRK